MNNSYQTGHIPFTHAFTTLRFVFEELILVRLTNVPLRKYIVMWKTHKQRMWQRCINLIPGRTFGQIPFGQMAITTDVTLRDAESKFSGWRKFLQNKIERNFCRTSRSRDVIKVWRKWRHRSVFSSYRTTSQWQWRRWKCRRAVFRNCRTERFDRFRRKIRSYFGVPPKFGHRDWKRFPKRLWKFGLCSHPTNKVRK